MQALSPRFMAHQKFTKRTLHSRQHQFCDTQLIKSTCRNNQTHPQTQTYIAKTQNNWHNNLKTHHHHFIWSRINFHQNPLQIVWGNYRTAHKITKRKSRAGEPKISHIRWLQKKLGCLIRCMDLDNARIIWSESNKFKCWIKEAIEISRRAKDTINRT